ncbi:hypothetical protein AOC36_08575 [Erysipelothrix larvae]|uniref:Sortase n=1 Tax=Erysipelothrix larvae TaxID=1514105 RepID=A0A0X8H136_9FIRM|nr:hypothetical protein [Erysipelothrix larvae]AMC94039.1 hypothetical protein AOC36_08575 [Erysipelothrix larvae]
MLFIQEIIKDVLVIVVSGFLTLTGASNATSISDPSIILDETHNKKSAIYDPVSEAYDVPLETVLEEAQEALDEERALEQERLRLEQEAQAALEQEAIALKKAQEAQAEVVVKTTPKQETVSASTQPETPAPQAQEPAVQAPKQSLSQYVSLNGTQYPFKELALNTQVAQNFIDTNPGSYGLWQDVTYATTFDILFAHYYAAGKLVYDANVGNTITLKFENGETRNYRVVAKTIQSVNAYYDSNSSLWDAVGTDFDLMIKTCYDVGVTDIIITLVQV